MRYLRDSLLFVGVVFSIGVWSIGVFAVGMVGPKNLAFADDLPAPPLKVGGILHLTGEFSIQGTAFREGMELGAEVARETEGQSIELFFEDTQYSALKALTAAKKLLSSDHVHATIISTAVEAKAAGPELQRAGVPSIVLWDSSPELEAIGDQMFSIGPWIPASGERMASFAKDHLHAKTAAIVHSNTEWSFAAASSFQKSFLQGGGKILLVANENPNETDFRTSLLRAKRQEPDVYYFPVDANLIAFFNQAKQLRLVAPILTSDIITEDNLAEDAKAFEGVYQSMPQVTASPLSNDMLLRYTKKYQKNCTQVLFVSWGFDAVRLLAHASKSMAKGGSLKSALLQTKNFPGVSNTISMNERGSSPAPLSVFQIQSGRFSLVPEALKKADNS